MEKQQKVLFMAIGDPFEELTMELLNTDDSMEHGSGHSGDDSPDAIIDPETIFEEPVEDPQGGNPEKVDKDGNQISTNGEDTTEKKQEVPSAISSILTALKQDGVLPDVEDDKLTQAKTPEDFAEIIEMQVAARLDATEKRIKQALEVGVQPDEVKTYESVISYLDTLTEEEISEDTEEAQANRKKLIYQDFINRGFNEARAAKEVEKSFTAGTDIEDAKSALEGNKEFFTKKYNGIIQAKTEEANKEKKRQQEEKAALSKKALETKEPLPGIEVDVPTRRKILDNITKIVDKDADGNPTTVMAKFLKEKPVEAQYFLSLFYTLTNGFTSLDKVIAKKVTSATEAAMTNLDKAFRKSSGLIDSGNALFAEDDPSKSIRLDI